jgi:glycosyltransferase involved in cell wall biosynthesis
VKIAHVIHTFPPYSRAGSENYVDVLVNEQLRNHRVVVFHRIADPDKPEYEVGSGSHGAIPVATINRTFCDMTSFRDTYQSESIERAFTTFLKNERPDVVHFHHVTCLSTTCVQAARELGIPVVFTLHDFWLLCPRGQLVRRDQSLCESHTDRDCVCCMAAQLRIKGGHARTRKLWKRIEKLAPLRLPKVMYQSLASRPFKDEDEALEQIRHRTQDVHSMFEHVNRFISPSRFLGDRFVDFGIDPSKIDILEYGYDLRRANSDARPTRSPGDGPVRVAYLGTWIPTKGVHVLIEAFAGIEPSQAILDVYGYAPGYEGHEDYESRLRSLAGDATNIRFRGAYTPNHVPEMLAEAEVLVTPSIWYENSPLTIHEAFMAGTVVVTSDHGGLRELVNHEVNGLTFQPGSAALLRAALLRLALDRQLLARLAAQRTPVMSIEEHAAALDRVYASVRTDGKG